MAETMVTWGIKHVFGMVGHSNLGMADALRRQEEAGKRSFYGIRHEGAASFACSAYAKLTGRPAACFTYATLCGALGIRVETRGALDEALAVARDHDGPALVEVMTDALLV